ncbi:hypothetical protein [Pantoea agglomerans]
MNYLTKKIMSYPEQKISYQIICISTLAVLIFIVGVYLYYNGTLHIGTKGSESFYSYYESKIRGYLFSGFISVGSLLLSLHTFVIVNLKDKLYDSDSYKSTYIEFKKRTERKFHEAQIEPLDYYAPLNTLSIFLNTSIWLSILTAILQFSLGFIQSGICALICLFLSFLTILFLLNCLILIRCNVKIWLNMKK